MIRLIEILESLGHNTPFPYLNQIQGRLRELRTQAGKEKIRLLYYAASDRAYIILHGFIKRTSKAPEDAVRIAVNRMEEQEKKIKEDKINGKGTFQTGNSGKINNLKTLRLIRLMKMQKLKWILALH